MTKPNRDITAEILKEFDNEFGVVSIVSAQGLMITVSPIGLGGKSVLADKSKLLDFIAQALTKQKEKVVKYVRDEVIGEDEQVQGVLGDNDYIMTVGANQLRAEQRQKLDNLLK